jgi:hypothetical protein
VANALQRINNTERSLSRASTMNAAYPIGNHRDEPMNGRESIISGQPPSSMNQYSTSTPMSNLGLSTGITAQIENPVTNLQEYCKANMLYMDIKAEACQLDPKNPDQRRL